MSPENFKKSKDRAEKLAKGLSGILETIDSFFLNEIDIFKRNNRDEVLSNIKNLKNYCIKFQAYSKKGRSIIDEIKKDMENINNLLTNVPMLSDSFKMATKGLKGASSITEEAAIKIQDASDSIQNDLDEVTNELKTLIDMESLSNADKKRLENALNVTSNMADTAFNIMIALQFQDILRQQLSAVSTILSQTRAKISNSINKLTGLPVMVEDELDLGVTTDASILTDEKTQAEVDEILRSGGK